MQNRMAMEQIMPADDTGTGVPKTKVYISHGKGNLEKKFNKINLQKYVFLNSYPTVTSKILEPTEEDTAMSPNPLRATIMLVNKSGIEVPAAKNVKPITCKKDRD